MNSMMIFRALTFSFLACVTLVSAATGPPAEVVVDALDYVDVDGFQLRGHISLPASTIPAPAVIIIPDWDGVNLYEQQRATMLAEMGYVGFAADIYGSNDQDVADIDRRRELSSLYRGNSTLFVQRMKAAINFVKGLDTVNPDNVGMIGYCFGGTGVIMYAMSGEDDVNALVSFHGGLANLEPGPDVNPKLLILSGGDDDTSTAIVNLEDTLDTISATWELTRYSGIQHAFTVFSDDRYNELADERSWASMSTFLAEALGSTVYDGMRPVATNVSPVDYVDTDGAELTGYVSFPGSTPAAAVVIIPDWDGVNFYEQERATLLAEFGYVGFAADIYGRDLQEGLSIDVRIAQANLYRGSPELFVQRIQAAINLVKTFPEVDPSNIALIGYCFGGTGVVEYAYTGSADVKVISSFHGGHQTLPRPMEAIIPYTMILSGGADDAHGNQTLMEAEFNTREADWEITRYAGVGHGYTNWDSGTYNLIADARSFNSMLEVLSDKIAVVTDNEQVVSAPTPAPAEDSAPMPTSASSNNVALTLLYAVSAVVVSLL